MTTHKTKALNGDSRGTEGCRALNAAIRKYGWHLFKKEVLYSHVPRSHVPCMEIMAIASHQTKAPRGYNLTEGGEMSAFNNPDVRKRAEEKRNTPEGKAKRNKINESIVFRQRVSVGSREAWNILSPSERQMRAQRQANGRRKEHTARREARMATMSNVEAERYWRRQKKTCLSRIRLRMARFPERFVGQDPISDLEQWFGPSFDERNRG